MAQKLLTESKEMVNHPDHYKGANGLECIDVMEQLYGPEMTFSFCVLNAFKYQWRFNNKGSAKEDLKKASWYNNKAVELLEKIKRYGRISENTDSF